MFTPSTQPGQEISGLYEILLRIDLAGFDELVQGNKGPSRLNLMKKGWVVDRANLKAGLQPRSLCVPM